ncbi:uncharacterized protein G2W53_044722 [Senna tora]|uniref:Uncharacterized protein n=1 Tax=Senna tora TaxID=362788 RepID=A0A834W007_9FABA|nr:uncharacterized protein G2W53_044722 [Senna tora]
MSPFLGPTEEDAKTVTVACEAQWLGFDDCVQWINGVVCEKWCRVRR